MPHSLTTLYFGNKNYSSWSLRPWLFGRRSIADAFYAPVLARFRTYGIDIPNEASQFAEALFSDVDFLEWESAPITDRFDLFDSVFK